MSEERIDWQGDATEYMKGVLKKAQHPDDITHISDVIGTINRPRFNEMGMPVARARVSRKRRKKS